MTDTSLPSQPASPPANSYVDSYTPPTGNGVVAPQPPVAAVQPPTVQPSTPASAADPLAELEKALQEYEARQQQQVQKTQDVVQQTQAAVTAPGSPDPLAELEKVLDEYESKYQQQTASAPAPVVPPAAPAATEGGQDIEEQNIFELLGVIDAESTEKEAFLDELQTALWEDFLDKDLALLIDQTQLKEVQDLRAQTAWPENERQEKLIKKVEALVPDVEEIMLEKALELKEDMVKERLSGMKEYYAARPAEMAKIQTAEQQILAGRWKAGAQLLNTLTA